MTTLSCEDCQAEFQGKDTTGVNRRFCDSCLSTRRSGKTEPERISTVCGKCFKEFTHIRTRRGGAQRRLCNGCGAKNRKELGRVHSLNRYHSKGRVERYGLSVEEFEEIQETQNFACALCMKTDIRLCIDHCHKTGRVRGLLCYSCNTGLGQFRDDPALLELGAKYLRGDQ